MIEMITGMWSKRVSEPILRFRQSLRDHVARVKATARRVAVGGSLFLAGGLLAHVNVAPPERVVDRFVATVDLCSRMNASKKPVVLPISTGSPIAPAIDEAIVASTTIAPDVATFACADGTVSFATNRAGACSGHGGLKRNLHVAETAPVRPRIISFSSIGGMTCSDGTQSRAHTRHGACSHHGGVR